jgi:GNAT superfamily N-acetyltransferase
MQFHGIEIREFDPERDSITELTKLLNRSYKQLADMGFRYHATFQGDDVTKDRIADAYCLIGTKEGKIVATISYYDKCGRDYCSWYDKEGIGHFGQFGVEPEMQKNGIGSKLIQLIEDHSRERGDLELALDTAEGAEHLVRTYEKRGYRFMEYVQWPITNYRSVVMSKKLK